MAAVLGMDDVEVEKILDVDAKADKASKLGFSNEDVERAVAESSEDFYVNSRDDVAEAIDIYRKTSVMLDEYCGINDSPPSSNIINILQDCQGSINHIGKNKMPVEEEITEYTEEGEPVAVAADTPSQSVGPIKSRADAFKKLTEISEFFRKTEPHSPIPYILERAVKWGEMPLNDLIKELIPDSSARDTFGSLTGIKIEDDY